jgi:hypothetical protein
MGRKPDRLLGISLSVCLSAVLLAACHNRRGTLTGTCTLAQPGEVECSHAVDGGAIPIPDLDAFTCTGNARPDLLNAIYASGVPQGIVCADAASTTSGTQGYCCTKQTTACAYNPAADCVEYGDEDYDGYQCYGANRPESLNAKLVCSQGVREGQYVNYCCSSTNWAAVPQTGCQQNDSLGCGTQQVGWQCYGEALPKAEELGSNTSRADYFFHVCATPTPAPNPVIKNFCCYVPALRPPHASCVQHTAVPGCAPGRYGFACYGNDTPTENFIPMKCDPGVRGISAEGYPATLYCCNFDTSDQLP